METNENKKKEIILAILGGLFLLILVIGAAYSYYQVVANNNTNTTTITGNSELVGQATLTTNISVLKLNITLEMMNGSNVNTTYYATESGVPVTTPTEGSGIYTLATASITESEVPVDCSYSYDISATTSKTITDGSDANYKVVITESNGTETTYTLNQILSGVTYTGKINKLAYGTNQTLKIKAYLTNTESTQSDFAGNTIAIIVTPKSGDSGFSCDTTLNVAQEAQGKDFAQFLVDNYTRIDGLWSSGLEGDGYRYVGTGVTCSYDEGNYIGVADNQYTTPSCPTLYNYTRTKISDGSTTDYTYKTSCPSNTSTYTYSCTELTATLVDSSNVPNNFICFGTSDKTECKNNEAKYMYRIIGVFEGSDGNQHLKLISFKQLGAYVWNADNQTDVSWENSDMYTGLNGNYFLTNTTYDYLQNNTWLNKIEDWTWSAVNTETRSNSGPNYYNSLSPSQIYLHEMNRSSKTSSIGEWTNPTAKIGLMYVSDYTLSLGSSALAITGDIYTNRATLKTGWMHQSNNDTTSRINEWTLSSDGGSGGTFNAWVVSSAGFVRNINVRYTNGARPVFHLTSDARINGGNGEYTNPYILE